MKKLIPLLILILAIALLTACDIADTETPSDTETTPITETAVETTKVPDGEETFQPDQTEAYANIPSEYHNLLDAYIEALTKEANGKKFDIDAEYPDLPDLCKSVICEIIANEMPTHMGYATKDINHDGISELFFLNTFEISSQKYIVKAIFTINNKGEPHLVLNFNTAKECVAITSDGTVYYEGYTRGESIYFSIFKLSDTVELCGVSFGHHDMTGFDDPDVYSYINVYDKGNSFYQYPYKYPENNYDPLSKEIITDEKFGELVDKYRNELKAYDADGCGNYDHVTRDAGLVIYTVLDPVTTK